MAKNIYSYNSILPQTQFDSDYRIGDQTVTDWANKNNVGYGEAWGIREAVIKENYGTLGQIKATDQLEGIYKTLNNNLYSGDVRKFNAAMPSWESYVDMRAGRKNGSVITFDTETFGDTTDLGKRSESAFGITEIGINRQVYENGDLVAARQVIDKGNLLTNTTHSDTIIIGVDQNSNDYKWLKSVIDKASTKKGRAGLTDTERVAFDRLTMYSSMEMQESKLYPGLYSVSGVHKAVDSTLAASQGLQKLTMAYDSTGSVENAMNIILRAEGIIGSDGKLTEDILSYNTILNGANAGYDYNILGAKAQGLSDVFSSFGNLTADQVHGIRAMAAANDMSVPQFLGMLSENGTMGGASMDSALKALGFAADQAHSAGQDTINETFVGDALSKWLGDNLDKVKTALEENGNFTKAPADSLYFFHHGALDKSAGLEFGAINGQSTPNFSFRNQFWEVDPSRTGTVTMNIATGEGKEGRKELERYVMTFTDAAEGYAGIDMDKRSSFTITGASSEEVMEKLNKMASAYDRDSSLLAQNGQSVGQVVMQQKRVAQTDFARREWDKILDAAAVTQGKAGESASGGYALLKRYLELDDALTKGGIKDFNSVDAVSKIAEFFSTPSEAINGIEAPTSYEMQTLAALRGKLNNERQIIDAAMGITESFIPESSDSYYKLAGNTLDTIRFRDAYNYLKNAVSDGKVAADIKSSVTAMTDILGVDMRIAGDIVRIDHTTTENFASRLSSAFSKRLVSGNSVDRAGLMDAINDLGARGLISDTTVSDAITLARTAKAGDMYNIASMIATDKTFNPDTWNDLYPWDAQAAAEGAMRPNLLRSLSKENEAERMTRFLIDGQEVSLGKYLDQNPLSDSVIDAARKHAGSVVPITHMSMDLKDQKSTLNLIMDNLGYRTPTERGLISDLFSKKGVNYSMGEYRSAGLRPFIIDNGESGSAFIAISTEKNVGKVLDAIASGADTSSYNKIMANDTIARNATILEIPRINTYHVGGDQTDRIAQYYISKGATEKEAHAMAANLVNEMGLGDIQSINLGEEFEVMISPELKFVKRNADQAIHGYLNGAGYDTLSAYRTSMKSIIDATLAGEFEEGSRLGRKRILAQFGDFPSTSSYRAIKDELGNVHRVQTWTPNDLMYANRIKEGGALYELLGNLAMEDDKEVSGALRDIFQSFSDQFKVSRGRNNENINTVINNVLNRSDFKEYFHKHLFYNFDTDDVMTAFGKTGQLQGIAGSNFFNEMYKSVEAYLKLNGEKGAYSKDVLEALDKFHALAGTEFDALDQILGVNAYQKGYVGIGVNSATYRPYASSQNTMRPTYNQAGNPVRFNNSMFDENAAYATSGAAYLGLDPVSIAEEERFATLKESLKKEKALGRNVMDNLDDTSTTFLLKVKNMSDYDVARRYAEVKKKGFTKDLKNIGLTKDNYLEALEFFEGTYSSLHEGAVFIRPSLGNAEFMRQREAMNLKLDLNSLDIDRTKKMLTDLTANGDTTLTFGSIIGYKKNGNPIFYEGANAIFTSNDVANLLPEGINETNFERFVNAGKTKVMPSDYGDFSLTKLFVGGSEKAMGHTANVEEFMRVTGIKDLDTAMGVIDNLWVHVLGTAGVVGNYGPVKHASSLDMQSMFNIVAMNYEQAGGTDFLANIINQRTKDTGIAAAVTKSGRLMLDDSNAVNASQAYRSIIDDLMSDYGDTDTVKNISKMFAEYTADNSWLLTSQVQTINEHMGKRMFVDDRMRQTLYLRNMSEGLEGITDMFNNTGYLDAMWDYSKLYNAHARSRENQGLLDYLGAAYDTYAEKLNASHLQNLTRNDRDAARKIGGLMDAMKYYYDASLVNKDEAIRMTMTDITTNNALPRGGMNALEAQNSIFFVDGKPSQFLLNQVNNDPTRMRGKKGILLDLEETFKITVPEFDPKNKYKKVYVKQNGRSVPRMREIELSEIFLPFQELDSTSDEYFVKKTENYTAKFLSTINDIKHSSLSEKERAAQIGAAYTELMENYATQLQSNNKDADMYRSTNRYEAPNSLQMQARSEASPMTEAMRDDKELARLNDRYDELSRQIADGNLSKEELDKAIVEYTDISVKRQKRLNEIADAIENNLDEFDALVDAPNKWVKKAMRTRVNDKDYYGMVATTSEEAFKKMGLDFNKVGMDIVTEYESRMNGGMFEKRIANNLMEGVKENFTDAEINAERKKIVQRINDLGIIGERTGKQLILDDNIEKSSIILQLEEFLEENYDRRKDLLRSVNESITKGNKGINAIFSAFSGIENGMSVGLGYDYMERVGTYTNLFRYPLFDSQPVARIMLDRRLRGNELSLWNSIFTHKTHVDFDGDTMFLSLFLDGTSVLKMNDELFKMQKDIYNTFAKNYSRKGIAEGIRSGDAVKKDLASVSRIQDAAALRLINENEYNKAVTSFMDNHSDVINELMEKYGDNDSAKSAIEFIAMSSDEMRDAFNTVKVNFATDPRAIMMSVAAKERNLYIGNVSTPNYKLRNTLIQIANDPGITDEGRTKLAEVIHGLYNTFDKEGGLLTIAEQKAIDTKKASDALMLARTGMYTTGIGELTSAGARFAKDATGFNRAVAEGIEDIIVGSGPNVYKFLGKEGGDALAHEYAYNLGQHTYDELKGLLDAISNADDGDVIDFFGSKFSSVDKDIIEKIATYRGVAEIMRDHPDAVMYSGLFSKGSGLDKTVQSILIVDELRERGNEELLKMYEGTSNKAFFRAIINDAAKKTTSHEYLKDMVYFAPNLEGDKAYVYDGTGWFDEINPETGEQLTRKRYNEVRGIDDSIEAVSKAEYMRMKDIKAGKLSEMAAVDTQQALNIISGLDEGNQAKSIAYITDGNLLSVTDTDSDNLVKSIRAFNNINKGDDVGSEIIRQLNKRIADNPGDYSGQAYIDVANEELRKSLGVNSSKFADELSRLSGINADSINALNESIDKISNGVYNVKRVEADLNEALMAARENGTMFKNGRAPLDISEAYEQGVNAFEENIGNILDQVRDSNARVVSEAQENLYKSFGKNYKGEMDALFNWSNGAKSDSIVGFGENLGASFRDLRRDDVNAILNASTEGLSGQELYATKRTQDLLKEFMDSHSSITAGSRIEPSTAEVATEAINNLHKSFDTSIDAMRKKGFSQQDIENAINQGLNENAKEAEKMSKKSLKETLENAGEKTHKLGKGALITGAAIAALGIAHKIMNAKGSSPLVPRLNRNDEQSNSPDYNAPAPESANKIYVDKETGYKFKMSVKARNRLNALTANQMAEAYGGGNVNISQNNKAINNQWLANKFAELANE